MSISVAGKEGMPLATAEELERRHQAYQEASAAFRLEGLKIDPAVEAIVQAWLRGEVSSEERSAQIRAWASVS